MHVDISHLFVLQAIAREDKGILGKDWNKSDKTFFRTASFNPTVPPEEIRQNRQPSSVVIPEVRGQLNGWMLERI